MSHCAHPEECGGVYYPAAYAEREVASTAEKWRCFHCDFVTANKDEAAAHFGDRDDPEEFKPVCKWWSRMSAEEKVEQFQETIQKLNVEMVENGNLQIRAEKAEALLLDIRDDIAHDNLDMNKAYLKIAELI